MKSLEIILKKFKEELLTEEETVQLIEDLYNKWFYYPWNVPVSTPSVDPIITYENERFPNYKVTCKLL